MAIRRLGKTGLSFDSAALRKNGDAARSELGDRPGRQPQRGRTLVGDGVLDAPGAPGRQSDLKRFPQR
jgi:hypothetical protein